MPDVPEIVKRAGSLPGAIAADLALSGGILRCGSCHAGQPLGDVASHLRQGWPEHCGLTMTWVTRKMLLAETRIVPDGHELVAAASEDWRLVSHKRCRAGAGPHRPACGRPSAAELCRYPTSRPGLYWAYCPDHMYGNWIEDGKVMHWVLREADASA